MTIEGLGASFGQALISGVGNSLRSRIQLEWKRQFSVLMKAAEEAFGGSREDLEEALAASPDLVPLTTRVLYAASMRGDDDVIQALGGVLGEAARQSDAVDEAEVLVGAIENLSRFHVQVLQYVGEFGRPHTYATEVIRSSGVPQSVAALCVNELLRTGFLFERRTQSTDRSLSMEPRLEVTETGLLILEILNQRRGQPTD